MADIQLYNTLTKKKEIFSPIQKGKVGMYHCGPTVYGRAHIGNLRAYITWDILRRIFEYNKYDVQQVINITDVGHLTSDADTGEDKMSKGLKNEGMEITLENMLLLARKYENLFLEDLSSLNILLPHVLPRASEHISEDIVIISKLEEKGFTYSTSDGIYFDVSKDPSYGKLVGTTISLDADSEFSRIGINDEKKNPQDFALWKFNTEMGWESPWGKGFPGWHIECSAMSERHLGLPFDIHTGGIDHIPVHHTNEIAQSENACDCTMAHYWLHNNHLHIDNEKIAKSTGNTVTLDELRNKNYSSLAFRYLILNVHYRAEASFTWDALNGAQNALHRLNDRVHTLPQGGDVDMSYKDRFVELINDDLNTPQALALTWELLKDQDVSDADKRATLFDFDTVLGLRLADKSLIEIPEDVQNLIQERNKARTEKDWERSDILREQIKAKGFEVHDTDNGTEVSSL